MFRAYGAASALVLLGFLLLNYFMPIPAASEESNEDDKMYGQISSDGRSSNTGQFGKYCCLSLSLSLCHTHTHTLNDCMC